MKNKRGAIGSTMTWVVATIIIFVVIIIFVYASGVRGVGSSSGSFYVRYKLTEIDKQQMLLALLETEFDGKEIKHYIILDNEQDYKELGKKIKPILEELPKKYPGKPGNWVFIISEGNSVKLQVGKTNPISRDINPSIAYFSTKKIELSFDYL